MKFPTFPLRLLILVFQENTCSRNRDRLKRRIWHLRWRQHLKTRLLASCPSQEFPKNFQNPKTSISPLLEHKHNMLKGCLRQHVPCLSFHFHFPFPPRVLYWSKHMDCRLMTPLESFDVQLHLSHLMETYHRKDKHALPWTTPSVERACILVLSSLLCFPNRHWKLLGSHKSLHLDSLNRGKQTLNLTPRLFALALILAMRIQS